MPHDDYYFLDFNPEFEYDVHNYLSQINLVDQLTDLLTVPSTAQLSLFDPSDFLTFRQITRDSLPKSAALTVWQLLHAPLRGANRRLFNLIIYELFQIYSCSP